MAKLETMVETEKKEDLNSLITKVKDGFKNWLVDTSAGWIFYTPLMGTVEIGTQYATTENINFDEIGKTRLYAALIHALLMRPIGKMRKYFKEKWNVNDTSSKLKKTLVNFSSVMMFQAPVYLGILYISISSEAFEKISLTLPAGVL